MRMINETAAGEFASSQAARKRDLIEAAKQRALTALREARFAEYDAAKADAEDLGCNDDIEAWACNIVGDEIAAGKYR